MKYWLALWLTIGSFCAAAAPVQIQPFEATYEVTYRGMRAGKITFELRREGSSQYVYRSTVEPSFLARMIVSSQATEMSRFKLTDNGVQPLEWHLEDGTSATKEDGALKFDATTRRVHGTSEDKTVDLPMEPNVQDRLSIQMEVVRLLLQGREPDEIPLIDDDRIKHYTYRRTAIDTVKTPIGELDTVVYESTRPSKSKRISRMWHAPALGYLPVKAEQVRDGRVETIMRLVELRGRELAIAAH